MSLEILSADVLERGPPSQDPPPHEIPRMSEPAFKSEFLQTMQARGYIHQVSDAEGLDAADRLAPRLEPKEGMCCVRLAAGTAGHG